MIPIYSGPDALKHLQTLDIGNLEADSAVTNTVKDIIERVRTAGDNALRDLAAQFKETVPASFAVPSARIDDAVARVPAETREVIDAAAHNIKAFAQAVMDGIKPVHLHRDGFDVGLDYKPVHRVGCYVPGGRYPLPSTALMTAMTAQVAGVKHIAIASPRLMDETLYAGRLAGVNTFYQVGGAQAVAALAYGTQSIAAVDMVVGPGNAYVTEAKRQLQGVIGIDMLAGPSEVAIIADAQANPHFVALDLLAQAEHDPHARAYLLTDSLKLAQEVKESLAPLVQKLDLPAFVQQSLAASALFVLPDIAACIDACNLIAPEHLEVHTSNPGQIKAQLHHYGALFMGNTATVPFGDYMSGPNHTLPTGRTARFGGSLTPLTFLRPQSWFNPTTSIQQLATHTAAFARLEGLIAHAAAADARINTI